MKRVPALRFRARGEEIHFGLEPAYENSTMNVSHWMCLKWIEGRVIHNEQQ
ncbi:hypothetical protein FOWG_17227 [Fusarium oxysporum f. sp. lycopersici MN25]|nr:hypothetical protein FOWG_17227 [Fusarium oxysporum f. sp. lycopersici MN25]